MNLFEAIKNNLKDLSVDEAFDEIKDYADNEWYLSPYARNLLKNCLDDSDKESSIRKIVHAVNTDSNIIGDTLYYLCTILKQCNISLTSEERDFEKYLDDFSESQNLTEDDSIYSPVFTSFRPSGQSEGLLGKLWFNIDDKVETIDLFYVDGEYSLVYGIYVPDYVKEFVDNYGGYEKFLQDGISYARNNGLSINESDGKISLQESDVDWKAVVDKIYKYINYEYNEIGSDDRYFLNNIIKSAVGTDKDTAKQLEKAKREETKAKQAEKDRLAKQKADREAKGITTYSLRGKKRDVLNSLESNLGKDFYVKEPGIDGILTIRRNDSNSGIRAYLQNKNLPDDVFGLVFEPVISKKISSRMQPIYNLSVGDYKTEIGSLGEFTGKEFKLTDIPKLTDTIKKVLSSEEV